MNTLDIPMQSLTYRYPGVRPFKKDEDILFYGRNSEINEMLHSLKVHNVFVLFSKSGLGKSSLINAGLSPRLFKEKMHPINVRFLDSNDNPVDKIAEEVRKVVPVESLTDVPQVYHNHLWLLFSIWDLPETPILIFDQFEEFFYYEMNTRAEAISQIVDLTQTKVPSSLKEKVKKNEDLIEIKKTELLDRFEQLSNQKASKPVVKLLFTIRSDKLSQLDEISTRIPGIFSNRYQLKPLKRAKAEQAIAMPAQIKQRSGKVFRSIPYEYSIESLRIILDALSNQQNDEVESTQLQIVCQEMENIAIAKSKGTTGYLTVINPKDFGGKEGVEDIVNKFYEGQLNKLRNDEELQLQEHDLKIIRNLIEDELLSSLNKRISQHADRVKGMLKKVRQDISNFNGVPKEEVVINKLLELRLIREEDSHLGKVYEISHDTLVESIVRARDKRKEEGRNKLDEQLNAEEEVSVDMLSEVTENKHCFVVMGLGKKTDFETGRVLDLDKSYRNMIKPAVEAAGLKCIRVDEILHSGLIDVPMFEQLLNADVVIADISTSNKNALYELGIRHALRPYSTIVISEDGVRTFPFDVNYLVVHQYHHLGEDIGYEEIMRFRDQLTKAIVKLMNEHPRPIDSPVYNFLRYLKPPTLSGKAAKDLIVGTEIKLDSNKAERKEWNTGTETQSMLMQQVNDAQKREDWVTAKSLLTLVRQMKKDEARKMQKEVKEVPEDPSIIQRLALITYKSKIPNEIKALNEARELLTLLDPYTTNDTETLGLWGAVHKRLWEATKNAAFLDDAVRAYERGFLFRNDYYNGINYAFLLNVRASSSPDPAEAIADFVNARRVRKEVISICEEWLKKNPVPEGDKVPASALTEYWSNWYWLMATMGEAYLGGGEAENANQVLSEAYARAPESWMQASTETQIDKLRTLLADSPLRFINYTS